MQLPTFVALLLPRRQVVHIIVVIIAIIIMIITIIIVIIAIAIMIITAIISIRVDMKDSASFYLVAALVESDQTFGRLCLEVIMMIMIIVMLGGYYDDHLS